MAAVTATSTSSEREALTMTTTTTSATPATTTTKVTKKGSTSKSNNDNNPNKRKPTLTQKLSGIMRLRSTNVLLVSAVIVTLCLTFNLFSHHGNSERSISTRKNMREQDALRNWFRQESIETRLLEILVIDIPYDPISILHDRSTPYGKAFEWLVNMDTMELHPDAPHLVQRYILAVLYYSTNGDRWNTAGKSFLKGVHECQWNEGLPSTSMLRLRSSHKLGVLECDPEGNVIQIDLAKNNLSGMLPPELSHLTKLQVLHMGDNRLGGSLHAEYGLLWKEMKSLDLSGNMITGKIPNTMSGLIKLTELRLEFNHLEGALPDEFCALRPSSSSVSSSSIGGGGIGDGVGGGAGGRHHLEMRADCASGGGVTCSCCDFCCDGVNVCEQSMDSLFQFR